MKQTRGCPKRLKARKIIQWVFLISLSILAMWFMKEVFIQFASNDTSMKQNEVDLVENPTITICFKDGKDYKYGVDVNISIAGINLVLEDCDNDYENVLDYEDVQWFVVLKKVYAYVDNENCFMITRPVYSNNTEIAIQNDLQVKFNDSITLEELPDIEVFITSPANADGIIFKEWMEGNELRMNFERVNHAIEKFYHKIQFIHKYMSRKNGLAIIYGLSIELFSISIWKRSLNVTKLHFMSVLQI